MGKKKIAKKTKIAPFVKAINYNHLMPTRYDPVLGLYNGGNHVGGPNYSQEERSSQVRSRC
jgi:hypothetical protein